MGFQVSGASSYDEADKRIANNILNYLLKHQESKDTLEGISQWWLEKEYIEATVDMVARGLSLLCAQGLIVEIKGGGTSAYYKLNGNPENDEIV